MGASKALLDFDGRCALEIVMGYYPGTEPLVVLGPDADAVRARVRLSRVAVNPDPGGGQTASLQLGLRALGGGDFFIHPVDFVLAGVAGALADAAEAFPEDVFIPSFRRRRGHPVLCRSAVAAEILALGPDEAVRSLWRPGRVRHVEVADDRVLLDMDTPGDYADRLARWRAER
jgi:molybdenum cofactor cytidylyltransferase